MVICTKGMNSRETCKSNTLMNPSSHPADAQSSRTQVQLCSFCMHMIIYHVQPARLQQTEPGTIWRDYPHSLSDRQRWPLCEWHSSRKKHLTERLMSTQLTWYTIKHEDSLPDHAVRNGGKNSWKTGTENHLKLYPTHTSITVTHPHQKQKRRRTL